MVPITGVARRSPAEKAGIRAGDQLLSIGSEPIGDVLDYRFFMTEQRLTLALCRDGAPFSVAIEKGEYEDLGLDFESYLMDEQRSCKNHCVFCFIDQNPPGMRKSIYFKDDDDRLSFLLGHYITLTNLTEHDVERILRMHISPINISVHTTDPELRVRMMRNPDAGSSLEKLRRLARGGATLHTQLVLCPGLNDGAALERTL
ncbi:MAG: PDZ domain-containing protein [Oscillospiraceae bacterium]